MWTQLRLVCRLWWVNWPGGDCHPGLRFAYSASALHSACINPFIEQGLASPCRTVMVKWFNDAKGFGFISPEDGTPDVPAHFSAINSKGFRSLQEGQRVSYDVTQGPKGAQASNIMPVE